MSKFTFIFALLFLPLTAQLQRVEYLLEMRMDGLHELYTGEQTHIWGFSTSSSAIGGGELKLPSPTLTARVGDSVIVTVVNASGEGHTIHWHGLDVDQENDGVPHTSDFVLTGDTQVYRFKATHAGNFIYHCHVTTTLHLMMGMYGSFIVYSQNSGELYDSGPQFEREYDYLGSELDNSWNSDFMSGGPLNSFSPDHFLLNGLEKQQLYESGNHIIQLDKGEKVLLRLINIGFSVDQYIFPEGINAVVHTSDGRQLPESFQTSSLSLYPGERYGVIIETDEEDFSGRITMDYLHMYEEQHQGTNYIGINETEYPEEEVSAAAPDKAEGSISVYPNPVQEALHIRLPDGTSLEKVKVFNTQGRLVKQAKRSEVDIHHLTTGCYIVEITTQNNVTRKKILKQ